jgi:5,10-methylenetetrahydromethanopterin reductase
MATSAAAGPALRASLRLNNDLTAAQYLDLVVAAEEAGFDQVWISHDLFLRSAPVMVAAAAGRTRTIGLGIGILNPYSASPVEIAMHAATLQELSHGRFLLGLGAGAEEFLRWAGLAREKPLAITRAAVGRCRALIDGDPGPDPAADAGGGPATLDWSPGGVPVYLGVMSPRMMQMAGEIADGVLALSFPPERAVETRRVVTDAARAAGRDPSTIDQPACFWCCVDDDSSRARAALAEKLAYYGPSLAAHVLSPLGLEPADFVPAAEALRGGDREKAVGLITDGMLSLGIAGDAADVLRRCQALLAAGFDHLSFGPPLGPDPVTAVARLGSAVVAPLRAQVAAGAPVAGG